MASDRLLLEQQVRQIDGMMRMMMDMRSDISAEGLYVIVFTFLVVLYLYLVRRQRGLMHRRVLQKKIEKMHYWDRTTFFGN